MKTATPKAPVNQGGNKELGARIAAHSTAKRNGRGNWDARAVCHDGKGATGLFYDPSQNFVWCNAGCDLAKISRAFGVLRCRRRCVTVSNTTVTPGFQPNSFYERPPLIALRRQKAATGAGNAKNGNSTTKRGKK